MTVRYIVVNAKSDLFTPATRSFGDIAFVGKSTNSISTTSTTTVTAGTTVAVTPGAMTGIVPRARLSVDTGQSQETVTVISTTQATFTAAFTKGHGPAAWNIALAINAPTVFTNPTEAKQVYPGDLGNAIERAFLQSPAPTTVWGVLVDSTTPNWDDALAEVAKLDVQIVGLANRPVTQTSAGAEIQSLANHVSSVSNTGGDGKERIGVAMLAKDATVTTTVTNNGTLVNERMVYVAHRSDQDAAAAVAGVIAGYEPHISILLKPVSINMPETFSDSEIQAFNDASVNWLTDPVLIPGRGIYMGEGYTGNPSGTVGKQYIDIVRTMDDISFRLKAALIQAIGNLRVSRSGLRAVIAIIQAVMSPLQAREVVDSFTVYSPLLVLLDKDPDKLTPAEGVLITQAHASRRVDLVVTVGYAGAIHRLSIDLIFK